MDPGPQLQVRGWAGAAAGFRLSLQDAMEAAIRLRRSDLRPGQMAVG